MKVKADILTDNQLYELEQLANEAKLRGVEFFGLDCSDWRDIPTSNEQLARMDRDAILAGAEELPSMRWCSVAERLINR